ncbi:DUF308 domain-containing protein [Gloeothece verrucosa]|uniref:DUF559 domain-containing protein n=1 Tax=Gloeothece verrucosa (strain PCC 7822) TaxID=497965 RepID=E0UNQ5_GLOV7|nr:DUF308 domain-containing protein [Gloeothece verrucosa]ADN18585.1 hypothetical protein Cyan7822_6947 [Gloeothece verrucosa PCC 7822]
MKVRLPTYSLPQRQQLIQLPRCTQSPWLWGGVGALIGFLAFILIKAQWNPSSLFLVMFGIIGVILGLWALKKWLKQYYRELEFDYSLKMEKWQKTQRLMQRYHQRKSWVNPKLRAAQLRELLQGKVLQPTGKSLAQQGVSEKYFFEILKGYFKDLVSYGGEFPIPGSQLKYSHDIVYIDPTTGLHIDIEIDEPYEGKSKRPHHCIDDEKDKRRNQYFLENNWIIIRFAEEQVVRHPHSCCKLIAQTLVDLTAKLAYLKGFSDIDELPKIECWTVTDARRMAAWKLREIYLEEMGVYKQMSDQSGKKKKKRWNNKKKG